jgi:hypothetical protein
MNPSCVTNNDVVTGVKGRISTGMVVTDDDHLLLCDYNSGKLVAVYPRRNYMKIIDVRYRPWDIAIIPRTHRAVVTFSYGVFNYPVNCDVSKCFNGRK